MYMLQELSSECWEKEIAYHSKEAPPCSQGSTEDKEGSSVWDTKLQGVPSLDSALP